MEEDEIDGDIAVPVPVVPKNRVIAETGDFEILVYDITGPTSECIFKVSSERLNTLVSFFRTYLEVNAKFGLDLHRIKLGHEGIDATFGLDLCRIKVGPENIDAWTVWLVYLHHGYPVRPDYWEEVTLEVGDVIKAEEKDIDDRLAVHGVSMESIDLGCIWQILYIGEKYSLPTLLLQNFFSRWIQINNVASINATYNTVTFRRGSDLVMPCYIFKESKYFQQIRSRLINWSVDAPLKLSPRGYYHIESLIREALER
ncbi:hypothetical protein IQ07DRAFT_604009 [Pyrenochaeta sp. DS3sAY3a]|nr:hypothetical protein IQ07DRAFT_604009 [Pyrenochaeta sp. DS3sAY3a]